MMRIVSLLSVTAAMTGALTSVTAGRTLLTPLHSAASPAARAVTVDDPPQTAHSRSHTIVGQLAIIDRAFVDDRGLILPVGAHAGDAFLAYTQPSRRGQALRQLDDIAAAGYQWVRVWTRLRGDWWKANAGEVGQEITPRVWEQWREFAEACATRGLRIHAVAGDLNFLDRRERRAYFEALRDAVGEHPEWYALVEWANESRDTAVDLGPSEAESDMRIVRERFNGLTALTAYTGHQDRRLLRQWTPRSQPFYYVHGSRGGSISDKLRGIFSLGYQDPVRWLGWQGEPFGPGPRVSVVDNQHELTDEAMAAAAVMALIARQAWTYVNSDGIINDGNFCDHPGCAATPRMVTRLEAFAPDIMRWPTLVHGGRSEAVLRFGQSDVTDRIDQATDGTRVVAVVHSSARSTHKDVVISPRVPMHLEVIDPASAMTERSADLAAGEPFAIRFEAARVVFGTRR